MVGLFSIKIFIVFILGPWEFVIFLILRDFFVWLIKEWRDGQVREEEGRAFQKELPRFVQVFKQISHLI